VLVLTLLKLYLKVLLNDVIDHMKKAQFISIISDGSTDPSVTDQETILLRYVHPDMHEPATFFFLQVIFSDNLSRDKQNISVFPYP
jgi:hypothetical protein